MLPYSARSCHGKQPAGIGCTVFHVCVCVCVSVCVHRNVRDAAQDLLQELYRDLSASLIENLQQQSIRPVVFRDLISKLDTISPTGVRIVESPPPGSAGVTAAASDISTAALGASTGPLGRSLTLPATRARPSSAPAGADPAAAAAPALPAPVLVVSDKELLAEMAAMVVPLTGTVADWQLRIGHMDRLQGLALGCPAQWHDTLLEGLRTLRDSLVTQVSTVPEHTHIHTGAKTTHNLSQFTRSRIWPCAAAEGL